MNSKFNEIVASRFKDFTPVFECIAGSNLYGTNTPESDVDIRGVFIPSKKYFYGFNSNIEQATNEKQDITFFEIRKFFRLCIDCNPNIVELLFVPEDKTIYSSNIWKTITANANLFLSKKARYTFSGYAVSQLHRVKQHRNWLLHPVKQQPQRSDFGLPNERTLVSKDQLNAFNELTTNKEKEYTYNMVLDVNFLELLEREKAFLNANANWGNYQRWLRERNPKRAALEVKCGYDSKHVSHLFRLLGEGKELLSTGGITFPRPDVKFLREIVDGKYTYDELMSLIGERESDEKEEAIIDKNFIEVYENSVLPHSPYINKADELCQSIIEQVLK